MSKTIVDFPKVAQMLDAGWQVTLYKGGLGSYYCEAMHSPDMMAKREELCDHDGDLGTDDFTPEQALTRLAYKCVDGIILNNDGTSNGVKP